MLVPALVMKRRKPSQTQPGLFTSLSDVLAIDDESFTRVGRHVHIHLAALQLQKTPSETKKHKYRPPDATP